MAQTSSRQLGELLINRKVLSRDVLEVVLDREAREGTPIAALLVTEGIVAEKDMIAAVAEQVGLPFIDLATHPVRPDLEQMIPADEARRIKAVVVDKDHRGYLVAMEDPHDSAAVATVASNLDGEFVACLAVRSEIDHVITVTYGVPMLG